MSVEDVFGCLGIDSGIRDLGEVARAFDLVVEDLVANNLRLDDVVDES